MTLWMPGLLLVIGVGIASGCGLLFMLDLIDGAWLLVYQDALYAALGVVLATQAGAQLRAVEVKE